MVSKNMWRHGKHVDIYAQIPEYLGRYKWLIDFSSMSVRQGLFYAKKLENCFHCTHIFTFWVVSSIFEHGYIWNIPI